MPAMDVPRYWTEEEFERARDAAPTGERWELVDGEVLVTPSPRRAHQAVVLQLAIALDAYVRAQKLGRVFTAPLDVKLERGMVTQPDVLAVAAEELGASSDFPGKLLLAVEVTSPSSARGDRVVKRRWYQKLKVPEYWIFENESQTVERWQPLDERPAVLTDRLIWHPTGATEPFVLDLPSFFADVERPY